MTSLIIVESFSKSKTIAKYLDNDFTVTYSSGHICDLPKNDLGINTENWNTTYLPTNKRVIENIRTLVRKSNNIYIASDPDIEGEAIAFHLKNAIKDLIKNKKCYRIKFNEITKNVILNAINNPTDVNADIVEAQETRRIVDRLIGYKISPLLWNKFNDKFLSAGRVQIAGLIVSINQKNKIQNKEILPSWNIKGVFKITNMNISGFLYQNKNIWKTNSEKDVLLKFDNLIIDQEYDVSYKTKITKTSPLPPYTTTSMQQDSYNKLHFNSKYTMKLSQDLYELGYITYIRTDSTNISEIAKNKIIDYIKSIYGEDKAKYRIYKTKIVNAQEAHEAIRVTNPYTDDIDIDGNTLKKDHIKLYQLIWRRTIACLMIDSEYIEFDMNIKNSLNEFRSTKSFLINEGFNVVYDKSNKKEDYKNFMKHLDKGKCVSKEFISNSAIDNIPSMYNEVQLIKELEKEGIGRPSTYSSTIDKLISKKYVVCGTNPQQNIVLNSFEKNANGVIINKNTINLGGKQKDLLIPTQLGINITEYIYNVSPYLCDLKFTSKMEQDMEQIINGKMCKLDILNRFYEKIKETIEICKDHTSVNNSNDIIKTKYGYCYYNRRDKKYTNIESYLAWKKKTVSQLSENDILFIKSLPKKIIIKEDVFFLNMGKYGLYLKDINSNNVKLDKKLWSVYE